LSKQQSFLMTFVIAQDDAPTLDGTPSSAATDENVALPAFDVTVTDPDSDITGVTLTASSSDQTLVPDANIGVALQTDAGASPKGFRISIIPSNDQIGTATISLTATSGDKTTTTTFVLTVNPVNEAPSLSGEVSPSPLTTPEDTEFSLLGLSGLDPDANDNLTISAQFTAGTGHFAGQSEFSVAPTFAGDLKAINAALGSISFRPNPNFTGIAKLTLTLSDGALSASRSFEITVTPVNDLPSIEAPASVSGSEDKPLKITTIKIRDSDAGMGALKLSWTTISGMATLDGFSSPISGTLTDLNLRLAHGFTFTPPANYHGQASLKLTLDDTGNNGDGGAKTATRSIAITIASVNDAPIMANAIYAGRENRALSSKLLATDPDGEAVTFKVTASPRYGTLALQKNGSFVYTPKLNWNGTDTFQATATDPGGLSVRASFIVKIKAVNARPILAPDSVKGTEDTALTIAASSLLKNDGNGEIRGEKDDLVITRVGIPSGFPGTLRLDKAKNVIVFIPERNWNGDTNFTYTVQDSFKAEATAKVTVQIAPVNDAPVTQDAKFTVLSGATVQVELKATDVEGDPLTLALQNKPQHGTATLAKVGTQWLLRYSATSGFAGNDDFTFTARDGSLTSLPGAIGATVNAGRAPKNGAVTPKSGKFALGSSVTFVQQVSDADGTSNLSALALLLSNSATTADAKAGMVLWFDAQRNLFTLGKDDGLAYWPSAALGQSLENAQVKVTLGASDIQRKTDGSIVVKWHVTFKTGWIGLKTLWGRVEDLGGASDGFKKLGGIEILPLPPQALAPEASAPQASAPVTSATNS
jgi:VCBS repeat-containing protein